MTNDSDLDQIKAVYEDNCAEIHGRTYTFGKFTHKKRLKIFAFLSKYAHELDVNNFSCLVLDEFEPIQNLIFENTLFDGMQISKLQGHWEKYEQDYLLFITMAMAAISYPFTKGAA